jgi:hypothetical protein
MSPIPEMKARRIRQQENIKKHICGMNIDNNNAWNKVKEEALSIIFLKLVRNDQLFFMLSGTIRSSQKH